VILWKICILSILSLNLGYPMIVLMDYGQSHSEVALGMLFVLLILLFEIFLSSVMFVQVTVMTH